VLSDAGEKASLRHTSFSKVSVVAVLAAEIATAKPKDTSDLSREIQESKGSDVRYASVHAQ
jgi:hypothetical protein